MPFYRTTSRSPARRGKYGLPENRGSTGNCDSARKLVNRVRGARRPSEHRFAPEVLVVAVNEDLIDASAIERQGQKQGFVHQEVAVFGPEGIVVVEVRCLCGNEAVVVEHALFIAAEPIAHHALAGG